VILNIIIVFKKYQLQLSKIITYNTDNMENINKIESDPNKNLDVSIQDESLAQTVCGLIESKNLGKLLHNEHILTDQTSLLKKPSQSNEKEIFNKSLTPETLGWIRHHGFQNINNSKITNIDTAISELMLYKQFGGDSIVDVTSVGLGRDPIGLEKISKSTNINIIMGASYMKPPIKSKQIKFSEESISDQIIKEINSGTDNTGIKAGIIGEIICTCPINSKNNKILVASGNAQKITGAPITIHPAENVNSPQEIIKVLEHVGTNLNKVIVSNLDKTIFDKSQFVEIANSGCYIGLDLFGLEKSFTSNYPGITIPNDGRRMDIIEHLINNGFEDKILISQNISTQDRLLSFGGHGYFYIINHLIPRMTKRGFTKKIIEKLIQTNPQRALSFQNIIG